MRMANGRDATTGEREGNESWIGLCLGMVVLDSLSKYTAGGSDQARWTSLLKRHGISADDANTIFRLRCSLLHGYSLPKPEVVGGRRVLLPPGALRSTLDGPDLEEVRFVRDEQANLVWAIETTTEDGTGRPWPGRERALDLPDELQPAPPTTAPLRYRLQTGVPINWIPLVPVQIDAARRAVALERAAMRRRIDGALRTVRPAGRILNPTNLPDRDVYRVREEQIARTGVRLFRADRRTRWTDGSTHLWTSRRRRAAEGEVVSGLQYDLGEQTDAE
jgi:hypothetical protein